MMVKIWCAVVSVSLLVALATARDDYVVVKTSTGLVKGKVSLFENQTLYTFLGIPYGKPPIGALRFSRPQMIDRWSHTHNAFQYGADCIPDKEWHPIYKASEDCLFLNVWVSRPKTRGPRPVIVYIHGGGFVGGHGRIFGDLFSFLSNTIVVTMNYRLNSFGFLNLYTEGAPGNMGLLDQQLALSWINMNIDAFGGDSKRITIMGESAGGASVGYQLLSPKSKGLFKRAAMHSGSPTDPWAFDTKVSATIKAMELADLAGCNRSDMILNPKKLVKCLQRVPAEDLNKMTLSVKLIRPMTFTFVPTVDWHFISATPYELLSQGKFKKTQLIIGTNKNDGNSFIPMYFPNYFKNGLLTIEEIVEITRKMYPDLSDAQLAAVMIHYFGTSDPYKKQENTIETGYMMGDTSFLCPSLFFADNFAKFGGKAHYYQFAHRKSGSRSWIGVFHGADLRYVLGEVQRSSGYTGAEKNLSKRMVAQWASFARTGDPSMASYRWPLYDKYSRRYYKIYTAPPTTDEGPRTSHCQFWKDIKYLRLPTLGMCNY